MDKTCFCGKELPYNTKEDILFFEMYHANCTNDEKIFEDTLVHNE
jgi:hypothetical protein